MLLDNYDSFTWNLVELLRQCQFTDFLVKKNDEIDLDFIDQFESIILSPGPGLPSESGITLPLIRQYASTKKILGVCLGHQAIAEAFGGSLYQLNSVCHGLTTEIVVTAPQEPIFKNLSLNFEAGLYHSWAVDEASLPGCLSVTALSSEDVIMAIRHREYKLCGIQFHPESHLTPSGKKLMKNWLSDT